MIYRISNKWQTGTASCISNVSFCCKCKRRLARERQSKRIPSAALIGWKRH